MCQIMKYNECGGIKSPHHFLSSLIWRLTFVAAAVAQSRCGFPPPKAEFAQSHGAQPSMINCEQLLCEQRGPLLVFIPLTRLNTGELLSAGSRQRLCVTRHFKWISTSCQTATARPFEQTESGQKKSEVELGKRDICPRLCSTSPLCSFIERAAEKWAKVIIIAVTITIIIALATLQFEPFGLGSVQLMNVCVFHERGKKWRRDSKNTTKWDHPSGRSS